MIGSPFVQKESLGKYDKMDIAIPGTPDDGFLGL
jgi:hypothetical protein